MSASIRPTAPPRDRRASARLAATVDLPTPPLPLATAITCRIPGSDSFCCVPWPCMDAVSLGDGLAQFAKVLERVDAGVVAVGPHDLVCVVTHRAHRRRPWRAGLQLPRGQHPERVDRLVPFVTAGGA